MTTGKRTMGKLVEKGAAVGGASPPGSLGAHIAPPIHHASLFPFLLVIWLLLGADYVFIPVA